MARKLWQQNNRVSVLKHGHIVGYIEARRFYIAEHRHFREWEIEKVEGAHPVEPKHRTFRKAIEVLTEQGFDVKYGKTKSIYIY